MIFPIEVIVERRNSTIQYWGVASRYSPYFSVARRTAAAAAAGGVTCSALLRTFEQLGTDDRYIRWESASARIGSRTCTGCVGPAVLPRVRQQSLTTIGSN